MMIMISLKTIIILIMILQLIRLMVVIMIMIIMGATDDPAPAGRLERISSNNKFTMYIINIH